MPENNSSSEQPQLPSLPEHVTVEWLTSVLGQKVKAIELTKDPILNASAGKVFVTITYDDENAETTEATKAVSSYLEIVHLAQP